MKGKERRELQKDKGNREAKNKRKWDGYGKGEKQRGEKPNKKKERNIKRREEKGGHDQKQMQGR